MEDKYPLLRFDEDNLFLEVRIDSANDTVWLTQREMAELFDVEVPNINYHLRKIYGEKELYKGATVKKI